MNGYLIALIIFLAWLAAVYALNRAKWFERHDMGLMGPLVMWRTRKGREIIERIASRKRLWHVYGMISLWICAASMFIIMFLLLWVATIVPQMENPPAPELILGIPGVNPIIPVGYGILGLLIAILVHEVAHGIMTRLGEMKIQSLGLVFLVFPVGAFVEPDEKALQAATRRKRSKVFAAGPASNIILAMLMLALFSGMMMSSVEPTRDGALALGIVQDSPLDKAGVEPSSLIVSVGGAHIRNADDFDARSSSAPGSNVTVQYYYEGQVESVEVVDGIVIAYVVEDYAAALSGMKTGMVLVSVNDTPLRNLSALTDAMALISAGQTVNVTVMSYSKTLDRFVVYTSVTSVTLSDKWKYYDEYNRDENDPSYHGKAYLGGGFLDLGVRAEDASYYADILANPFEGDRTIDDFSRSWLRLIALPFLDLAPIRSPVTDLYAPSGSMDWMPDSVFWLLTNSLYWIFWLNLMIGLTNVLPAVPLDGGYIFRDGIGYVLDRTRKDYTKEQKDKVIGSISLAFALLVLFLIVWQIVGPAF